MKEFTLDCTEIINKAELHKALSQGLDFPEWYGANLDALYDCLTGITEDTCIIVKEFDTLEQTLGNYAVTFRKVVLKSADDNEKVRAAFI